MAKVAIMPAPTRSEVHPPAYPRWVVLAAFAVLAAGLAVLLANWATIPESIPVHFGAAGPDAWEAKSFWSVTQLIWFGALLVGLMAASAAMGLVAGRRMPVDPARGGTPVAFSASLAQRASYLLGRTGHSVGWLALLVAIAFSYGAIATVLPRFSGHQPAALTVALIGTVAGGVTVAVVSVLAMSRARQLYPPDEAEQERTLLEKDGSLYRFGMFYLNPADPMTVVYSRSNPDNMDFNYAHPPGRIFAVVLGVSVVGVVVLVLASIIG